MFTTSTGKEEMRKRLRADWRKKAYISPYINDTFFLKEVPEAKGKGIGCTLLIFSKEYKTCRAMSILF